MRSLKLNLFVLLLLNVFLFSSQPAQSLPNSLKVVHKEKRFFKDNKEKKSNKFAERLEKKYEKLKAQLSSEKKATKKGKILMLLGAISIILGVIVVFVNDSSSIDAGIARLILGTLFFTAGLTSLIIGIVIS